MWNVKLNHKTPFTFCLFKQRKMNKTKLLLKFIKVFNLPVKDVKQQILSILCSTCKFHIYHAIFNSLEGDIPEVSKI